MPDLSLLASLTSSDWQVDRLPLGTQALVYSAFTIGTLYSYDSSIIGPSPYTNFTSLGPGQDLRQYGKRRRPAFEQMRDLALRAAREVDVWMEPTVDNAGTCNLLDVASRIGTAPFLGLSVRGMSVADGNGFRRTRNGTRTQTKS